MDQAEKPIKIQNPEEVKEHHENGASKMFKKVKARAKKFKNSLTKHGESHVHDHDLVEEDELEPEVIEDVTEKPESLSQPRETNVLASEEIGTKASSIVSSDYIKPIPVQDTSYRHEAPSNSVRTKDISDKDERRDAPTHHPLGVSELSDREESREAHHEPLNTPVSMLSSTHDVKITSAPGGEEEYLGGQRKVNVETPNKSKITDPTKEGSGQAGVPEIAESVGRIKVEDESSDKKSGHQFDEDLSMRSNEFREFDRDLESVVGKDSSAKHGGVPDAELGKDFPTRSKKFREFDRDVESVVGKDSPVIFTGESDTEYGKYFPTRSHEFNMKTEAGISKDSPAGFGNESGAELGKVFQTGRHEFDLKTETGKNEYSPTVSDGGSGASKGENFPVRSPELGLKNESGSDKNSPAGFVGKLGTNLGEDFLAKGRYGYGEESETGLEKNSPAGSDDVKVETELGRDLPTGTHDQFSPELSRPNERDDFEEIREPKPSIYTELFATATSALVNQAIATHAVASKPVCSGETPVGDETHGAESVDEKLTPVKEKDRKTESLKSPLSGSGSGVKETEQGKDKAVLANKDFLSEKPTPGEEDKDLSEVMADKPILGGGEEKNATTTEEVEVEVEKIPTEEKHGEADKKQVKGGGGMVGMIKGWFGGGGETEEVKPSESGGSELGKTGVGSGSVPVQKGL